MAKTEFTLEVEGGETKTLTEWGFANPRRVRRSQERSTFLLDAPLQRVTDEPLIDFDVWTTIRRNDTPIFQGRRVTAPIEGRSNFEGMSYELVDPWIDLETICFQMTQLIGLNNPTTVENISSLFLFTKITDDGSIIGKSNTGEQMVEILTWAIARGARLKIGNIEPAVNVPSRQVQDIMCSEAIRYCLQSSPDATTMFDYSTTPPTFNCRLRAGLMAKSLPFAKDHSSTKLTARYDLQVPSVCLKFKRLNQVDNESWLDSMAAPPNLQIYPLNATGLERRALVQTIDLAGIQIEHTIGKLVTDPIAPVNGSVDERKAWWAERHTQFKDTTLRNFSFPGEATITDSATGAAIDTSVFKYSLSHKGGQIAEWMKIKTGNTAIAVLSAHATVSAKISYDQYSKAAGGVLVHRFGSKQFTEQVVLTNAPSGIYSDVKTEVAAEAIPEGLAQSIYESLAKLQWEGEHEHQDPSGNIQGVIDLEHTLNISGGRPEWADMEATIQTIDEEFETGVTRITVGPAKHLSAGDRTALFLSNRFRFMYQDPSVRGSGKLDAGKNVNLGDQTPKQDTAHDMEQPTLYSATQETLGGTAMAQLSAAETPAVKIQTVDENGATVDALGAIVLDTKDCNGKAVKLREFEVCVKDANGNSVVKKCLLAASEPYD